MVALLSRWSATRYRAAMDTQTPAQSAPSLPRSLFVFALIYGGMTVLAGVLGNKQVALGPLAVEAGIFAFLMLVVLSSAVAELHGRAMANRMVIVGFVPLILAMALIGFVLGLPAAADMDRARLEAFQMVLSQGPRLMGAGILAYGISTLLNVRVFSALRGSEEGGSGWWLMARGAIASALSQVVDTLIFITVAFYGVFPIGPLLVGQMIAKVALSLIVVPVVIQGAVVLGRKLDGMPA